LCKSLSFVVFLFILVLSSLHIKPNVGSDRSWVYTTPDSAEDSLGTETFAVKLGNVESAKEFFAKFEEAQAAMKELKL
jgi:Ran-binding protein 1